MTSLDDYGFADLENHDSSGPCAFVQDFASVQDLHNSFFEAIVAREQNFQLGRKRAYDLCWYILI